MENNVKPGYKTTEFWLTGLTAVAGAIVAVLVSYGVLSTDEGQMWLKLIVAVVPLAFAAYSVGKYSESRASVKSSEAFAWPVVETIDET